MSRKDIAKEVGVVAQNTVITFPFTVLDMVLIGIENAKIQNGNREARSHPGPHASPIRA